MNKFEKWILDDICLCASKECPRYNKCLRGLGYKKATGVFTVSLLSEVCNESNDYEMFINVNTGKEYIC